MTEPPRQAAALTVLIAAWLVLGTILFVQGKYIGVAASVFAAAILGGALVYTRRRRGPS